MVADMMVNLFVNSNIFNASLYPDLLHQMEVQTLREEDLKQTYYLCIYLRLRSQAKEEFTRYLQLQPVNAWFAMSRMASHGMGETATKELASMLSGCGYPGAAWNVVDTVTPCTGPTIVEQYQGTCWNMTPLLTSHVMSSSLFTVPLYHSPVPMPCALHSIPTLPHIHHQ
jgi:hypothetical protein